MNSNCTKSSDLANQIQPTPVKVTSKSFGPIGLKIYSQPHYLLKDEDKIEVFDEEKVITVNKDITRRDNTKTHYEHEGSFNKKHKIEVHEEERKYDSVEKDKTIKGNYDDDNVEKFQQKQTVLDIDSNNKSEHQTKSVNDIGSITTSYRRYYPEIIKKEKPRLFSGKT